MDVSADDRLADLLRGLAPQVLGAVVRRYGNFDAAEDATQEALIAAARRWPSDGLPADPLAWLIRVASRRLTDALRSDGTRRTREQRVVALRGPTDTSVDPGAPNWSDRDDTLILLLMCCHPELPAASRIALTLRAVGGLTTAEVARALMASEATIARRITRAKQSIRERDLMFSLPAPEERGVRLAAVMHVIYLVFNEGYASTSGPDLQRRVLSDEAVRLARLLRKALPEHSEVAGLLALMLLIDARRDARVGRSGELIPMAEQDRSRWDRAMIEEGTSLISAALPVGPVGPYQLQAAIAALHDEAPSESDTDWPQIVALYDLLLQADDNPVIALNRAVAVAMASGHEAGLRLIDALSSDSRLERDHRLHAVRAHLLERAGDVPGARAEYHLAARLATNVAQQRFLVAQLARLDTPP